MDQDATGAENSSGVTPDSLKTKLEEKLEASHVDIQDMSGIFTMIIRSQSTAADGI